VAKGPGGIISGGFQPLKAPDAPTIDSVSAGVLSADVTFSAPADTGAGSVDSYVVTAKQSDGSGVSGTASAAGTVSLTLTAGGTTTFAAQAISNAFGPGQFSGFGNSSTVFTGQELYSWGRNNLGQLAQNDIVDRSSPVQIGALTNWNTIDAGYYGFISTKTDGTLWTWGSQNGGQLGHNDYIAKSSPVQVGGLTNWSSASMGISFSAGIEDSELYTWGNPQFGALGNNTAAGLISSPVQIGALTNWSVVSSGRNHSAAIKNDGTLWAWGYNGRGQLGVEALGNNNTSSPVQVGAETNWYKVSTSQHNTAAIKTNGTLWVWGRDTDGTCGQNSVATGRSSPVQIGSDTDWAEISTGSEFCFAIKTDGTLWSWGQNSFNTGQLGQSDFVNRSSPTQVGALTNWNKVSGAVIHALATKTDGTLWSWGSGSFGKLGQNDIISRSSPIQVGSLTSWVLPSAGGEFLSFSTIGTT